MAKKKVKKLNKTTLTTTETVNPDPKQKPPVKK